MPRLLAAGLLVTPMFYSELCSGSDTASEVDGILNPLKLDDQELSREALFLAAKAFLQYRKRGGNKTAPQPDFFIEARAEAMGIPISARDPGR